MVFFLANCTLDPLTQQLSNMFPEKKYKEKQLTGKEASGLTHECGLFGAIACGDWPTRVS